MISLIAVAKYLTKDGKDVFISAHSFTSTVHCDGEGMGQALGVASHTGHSQDA